MYTPIMRHTFEAALHSAYCALTGAAFLVEGERHIYALCRPPGHHAGVDTCGGYCYFNNAAIAATSLKGRGKVAILDVDYHHGNGTQNIFYGTDQVLFISIHGHPDRRYPYFWGFSDETGVGAGEGYNYNFPLPADVTDGMYLPVLQRALEIICDYGPEFLIISAGFDTYKGDPIGDFKLTTEFYGVMGREMAGLGTPTLILQEGGYNDEQLGENVVRFLQGWPV
jgi:acetoin utilization deacetylase AcuC-like enzyme